MAKGNKCPYCSGNGDKVIGHVVMQSSHLTFGYGERVFQCKKCREKWVVCYSVPPKRKRKDMVKPDVGILGLGFTEGVRGYANPTVLTANAPASPAGHEPSSEEPTTTEEGSE